MSNTDQLIAAGFKAIDQSIQQQQARLDTLEANVMAAIHSMGRELAEEKKSAFDWLDLFVNASSD